MPELIREPLYQQIVDLLLKELADGRYPPDARFPSEREIAARFAISRTTANKVLSMLVADGQLEYKKGVGAFVAGKPLEHDMSALLSFTEKARRGGLVPQTRVLKFEDAHHEQLGDCFYLERLRSVDGIPVIYERRYLVRAVCQEITTEMAGGSLYEAMKRQGIEVAYAEQRARAVAPTPEERSLLQIKQGCACLRVEGRGYLAGGAAIWQENTLFRGDRYEIHATLNPQAMTTGRIIR